MSNELKGLYSQYKAAGNTESYEHFIQAKDDLGDDMFYEYVNSQIDSKKKVVPGSPILNTNQGGVIPTPVMEQALGKPMDQVDSRWTDTMTNPFPLESESSSSESSLESEFGSTPTNNQPNIEPTPATTTMKPKDNSTRNTPTPNLPGSQERQTPSLVVGELQPIEQVQNPKIETVNGIDIPVDYLPTKFNAEQFAEENKLALPQSYKSTDVEINSIPFNSVGYSSNTAQSDILSDNANLENLENDGFIELSRENGNVITDNQGRMQFKITDKDYYDKVYSPYIEQLKNSVIEDRKQHNRTAAYDNRSIEELPQSEMGAVARQYYQAFGQIPDNSVLESINTKEDLIALRASIDAEERLKDDPRFYDEIYRESFAKYDDSYTAADTQTGKNVVALFRNRMDQNKLNENDVEERKMYNDLLTNEERLGQFGKWWKNFGELEYGSTYVRQNRITRQDKRMEIFSDFYNSLGDNDRILLDVTNQKTETLKHAVKEAAESGDLDMVQTAMNAVTDSYNSNIEVNNRLVAIDNESTETMGNFKRTQEQLTKEANVFDEFLNQDNKLANYSANAALGIASSLQAAATGLMRLATLPFGEGNVSDAIDDMSGELKIGGYKASPLSLKIEHFKGKNNEQYRNVNGNWYSYNDGAYQRLNAQPKDVNLEKTTNEYTAAGAIYMAAKTATDIYTTTAVGGALNKAASRGYNVISGSEKLNKVATAFGKESVITKHAASFNQYTKNPKNVSVSGWMVQMTEDSYQSGKDAGLEGSSLVGYTFLNSVIQAGIQRINPDINFLKSANTDYQKVVKALLDNKQDVAKQAFNSLAKKMVNNTLQETPEELTQLGAQDLTNTFSNLLLGTDFTTSTSRDYKETADTAIGLSMLLAAAMGGRSRTVRLNNQDIDLSTLNREEILTELALMEDVKPVFQEYTDSSFFASSEKAANDLLAEVNVRKKYIDKIPNKDNYTTDQLALVTPLLQEAERKREELKNVDEVFKESVQEEIDSISTQIKNILNAETGNPQAEQEQEAVQNETPTTEEENSVDINSKNALNTENNSNFDTNEETGNQRGLNPDWDNSNPQNKSNETESTEQREPTTTVAPKKTGDQTDEVTATGSTNTETNQAEKEVTTFQTSSPNVELEVSRDGRGFTEYKFINPNNKTESNPSEATRKKYILEHIKSQTFEDVVIPDNATAQDANAIISTESNNPHELALALGSVNKYVNDTDQGSKTWNIANAFRRIKSESFTNENDKNRIGGNIARAYFSRKKRSDENTGLNTIDAWAYEASSKFAGDYGGSEITPQDIIDFMEEFPQGPAQYTSQKSPEYQAIEARFKEITGLSPSPSVLAELAEMEIINDQEKAALKQRAEDLYERLSDENKKKLDDEYKSWFNSLSLSEQQDELIKSYPYELQRNADQAGETEKQSQPVDTKRQSGKNAYDKSGAKSESREGSKREQKGDTKSPEYKQLLTQQKDLESRVKTAKDNLDKVSRQINTDFQSDQEDLFGNRPPQEGMFDERASGEAGRKMIDDAKSAHDKAKGELSNLNQRIKDFESGKVSGTQEIKFEETTETETPKPTPKKQPTIKDLKKTTRLIRDEAVSKELNDALKDLSDTINKSLNSGINPEIILKGGKVISIFVKGGVYKFSDIVTDTAERMGEMSQEMFTALKGAYGAYLATAEEHIYKELDKNVRDYTLDMIIPSDTSEDVEGYKTRIQNELLSGDKLNIVKLRSIAKEYGLDETPDTTLQEYVEVAIIREAKAIANEPISREDRYDKIVELYNKQPTISMRSSSRIEKQQYSTPIPLSFLAGEFAKTNSPETVLEPSAGNGMMVLGIDSRKVIVNEIDDVRRENLIDDNFKLVLNQDAKQPFNVQVDSVVMNPPFGPSPAIDHLGYKIGGLDEQMVINALDALKDDGTAAIIIGGHATYKENGTLSSQKTFLNYLYNYYNVVDVIHVDGKLYSKQGTSFPTRLILINGRKRALVSYDKFETTDFAPLMKDAKVEPVTSFSQLYDRVNDAITETNNTTNEKDILRPKSEGSKSNKSSGKTGSNNRVDGKRPTLGTDNQGREERKQPGGDSNQPNGSNRMGDIPGGTNRGSDAIGTDPSLDPTTSGRTTDNGGKSRGQGGLQNADTSLLDNRPNEQRGKRSISIDLTEEKTPYPKRSKAREIGSVVPTNMAQSINNNLQEFDDIDGYVRERLEYDTNEDLYDSLSAEQVDAVALSIKQIENRKGFIVGDMTGVGKGRTAAALIRYAVNQGKKPIFVTEKPDLFSDIYRDLVDVKSGDLKPFIINAKEPKSNITDEDGKVIYSSIKEEEKKEFYKTGKVPDGYDYVVMTYSQVQIATAKRSYIASIANDNILILDESHNAGGADSATGAFFQSIVPNAHGVVYLSGTFAKSHKNMPVYALKTSISDANMSQDELIDAIDKGGVPLQEILSSNLVEAGQMIRRERDFNGVTIDWEVHDGTKEKDEEIFNQIIDFFNDIIRFQKDYINDEIELINDALAKEQSSATKTKGTSEMGAKNTPFASRTFNIVRQVLFAIKAETIANEAIKEIKAGRKPVIAFGSTMEGFITEFNHGEVIDNTDFSQTLVKGLESTLKYTITDARGKKSQEFLTLDMLSPEARVSYRALEQRIQDAVTGLSISPIDVIKQNIMNAGYTVGELTGRKSEITIDENGTSIVTTRRDRDKKKLTRGFNAGEIDVLLLNQSASTGISLHASTQFKDQKPRVMLSGQTLLDVNTEVQMRGRIDRTGQVVRGSYRYIISPIPAEQRLIMMFKSKLKSLDANTTSSQKSKTNEIKVTDFLNKYGDQIVFDYMLENPELNEKLLDPLKVGNNIASEGTDIPSGLASTVSGRVALLNVQEQERFYNEVSERYEATLKYLNDNNANDLEIKVLPLKAETKSSVMLTEGNNTGTVFGEDSILETVEIDVLKKPMTSEEYNKEVEKTLDGKTPLQYKQELIEKTENERDAQNERDRKSILENPVSKTELKKLEQGAADLHGDITSGRGLQYIETNIRINKEERIENITEKNNSKFNGITSMFNRFGVGTTYYVPSTARVTTETTYSYGKFLGFKMKDKYTPSSISAVFAVHDGRRRLEIPLSQSDYLNAIYAETMAGQPRISDNQWNSTIPTSTRRKAYIATGNLLQAYASADGQLITYTALDGSIKQGILMPEGYDKGAQKMRVSIKRVEPQIREGRSFVSIDLDVTITSQNGNYVLYVPRGKEKGGKYFLDNDLRDLAFGGEFRQSGNKMVGVFKENNLTSVLDILHKKFGTSVLIDSVKTGDSVKNNDSNTTSNTTTTTKKAPTKKPKQKISENNNTGEQFSTQDRNSNLTDQRITPKEVVPTAPPRSLTDIVSDLITGLKTTLIHGKSGRRNSVGSYDPRSSLVRIRHAGDLDTIAHEIGHMLDDRLDIFGNLPQSGQSAIDKEMKWFSDRGGSNPPASSKPSQKKEYLKREGLAEFIRAYIVNKEAAQSQAPNLFTHFEKMLDSNTKKVINKYSQDLLNFNNAPAWERISSNVESTKPDKKKRAKQGLKYLFENDDIFGNKLWANFNINILNTMFKANKAFAYINKIQKNVRIMPDNDFRILNRLFNGVDGKISRILESGLVDHKNRFLKDDQGKNMSVKWLFETLDQSSEKALEDDYNDVTRLMIAQRTAEYALKFKRDSQLSGIGGGLQSDLKVALEALDYFEDMEDTDPARFARINEAAERYRKYADAVLRYAVDKGRVSEKSYQAIKKSNTFYVNMMRIKEDVPGDGELETLYTESANTTTSKEILKTAKGGTDKLRNPYEALLMTTASIIREADRNEVMRSFIEPMRNNRRMGEGEVIDFSKVARLAKPGDKFTRKIFIKGELESWSFSKEVIPAVESLEGIQASFPGLIQSPAKLIRWSVTHFPVFAARNVTRDTVSRAIVSYTINGVKGLDLTHNKQDRMQFDLYGASMAGYFADKDKYKTTINDAMQDIAGKGGIVVNPKKAWSNYTKLLEKAENVNRIAEFKSAYAKAKKEGMDDYNARLYAASEARGLLDFAVAGKYIRMFNQVIPFLNAGVQGTARTARFAASNPGAFAVKTAIFTILPQLIARAIVSAMGDDEEYEQLPDRQRDFAWNFKTPFTGDKWISIPKPFENGLASSFVDRLYSYTQGNEKAFNGFGGSIGSSVIPVDESSWLGSGKPLIEVLSNKDFFRDNTIVPYWDEKKLRETRGSDEYASRLSKSVSNLIYSVTESDINPNNMDHLIKGYGTYYGNLGLILSDLGRDKTRYRLNANILGFSKDSPVASSKDFSSLTEILRKLGESEGKVGQTLKKAQRAYYAAENDKERKEILNKIYEYTDKQLIKYEKKISETKNK